MVLHIAVIQLPVETVWLLRFGRTSFSQGKNKIPVLHRARNKQKC